ncbi:MAG: succinate dehydrogenase assembly factor 2 [Tepidimonas sp.]|uniref:FAD assembly factor SdhE n=1 Tax=Tepidimonas sp. TaxID=2002775 RepID=UPI00259F8414|nr:succinate dehydrogenase assembly factor 2 [Tepidimonas sp.]MDM7455934.1 succinate dehydrogenase assembly factor 2 [Tepidimonas sp.]
MDDSARLDERQLSKLRWRCRRGLLENDLFIERFFDRYSADLTERQARGLQALMDLSDNDLLDLLLRRREPEGALATPEVVEVLALLRTPPRADAPPPPQLTR